jgi:hypothetical protein
MAATITRRNLVALAAAVPAAAQPPAAPPPIPTTPEEERQAILAQLRSNADALARTPLPMSTEPATRFRP